MKLEDQVCSLELSKKLRELGVKQESLFVWHNLDSMPSVICSHWKYERSGDFRVSAFTVAELFELLPVEIEKGFLGYLIKKYDYYEMSYSNIMEYFHDKNPANCLAKMLIHLIENKLMEVKK